MSRQDVWSELLGAWVLAPDAAEPEPAKIETDLRPVTTTVEPESFMDPDVIERLTPEINWDRRVGDRIRQFLSMANKEQPQ